MPILSAEEFRLSSERKLAVQNCPLLRSVLISTLLSNLDSDTRAFTAILAASNDTEPLAPAAPPCSPDRENMMLCDALLAGAVSSALDDALFESSSLADAGSQHPGCADADVAGRGMPVTEAELDFADVTAVCAEPDALLLGDRDSDVLDSSSSNPNSGSSSSSDSDSDESMDAFSGLCRMGCRQEPEMANSDPEALPVDIISVASPCALTRADPLFCVQASDTQQPVASQAASPRHHVHVQPELMALNALSTFEEESAQEFTPADVLLHAATPSSASVAIECGRSSDDEDASCAALKSMKSKNKKRVACEAPSSSHKRLKKIMSSCTPLSERLM